MADATPATTPAAPAQASGTPSTDAKQPQPSSTLASPGQKAPQKGRPAGAGKASRPGQVADGVTPGLEGDGLATPAQKAPADAEETLYELKVNGETLKLTQQQLIQRAQKAEAAQRKWQESAEHTKRNQQLLSLMKDNPEAALEAFGIDVDALAESRLSRKAQEALMDPRDLELHRMQQRLQSYENQQKQHQETQAQQQQAAHQQKAVEHLEKVMVQAAQEFGLEGTPDTLIALADIGAEAAELGLPLTPQHLAQEFKDREAAQLRRYEAKLAHMDGDKLLSHLPPGLVQKILEASVAKLHGAAPTPAQPRTTPSPDEKRSTYTSEAEFRRLYGV